MMKLSVLAPSIFKCFAAIRGRFPRVFGDEFDDKYGEKLGDSLNLVKTLVTNSVTKLVNHQIW